jgi:hypothetical protein
MKTFTRNLAALVCLLFGFTAFATGQLPIFVEAETFDNKSAAPSIEACSSGGCSYVSGIQPWEWLSYDAGGNNSMVIPEAGDYTISYNVSSVGGGGILQLEEAGTGNIYGTLEIPATGALETWTIISHVVTLPQGEIGLGIKGMGDNWNAWNLDWFSISTAEATSVNSVKAEAETSLNVYPNPAMSQGLTISFDLKKTDDVVLSIIDISGIEKEVLINSVMPAGVHKVSPASQYKAGIYFARLESSSGVSIVKFVVE